LIPKTRIEDLAVFGGPPAFAEKLHVGRPNIGDRARLRERIESVFDSRWLTNDGPLVQELERRIAALLGVRHCVATANGTVAIEIAARALRLAGEVIVPSFTFIATAHALQWLGITPVFCDVDPRTHNLDPRGVEKAITSRTTAILGVHVWGRPCEPDVLAEIANRHRLRLIFDAAHAFSCSYQDRMIGNFGDAEIFSFHATKFFNTLEGGAITTNNDDLAARLRLMRNFGFASFDNVTSLGTNGKMSEICAAMGLTGLESLEDFVEINRRNFHEYGRGLAGIKGIDLIAYDESNRNNFQYVVLEVSSSTALGRDDLHRTLQAENVLARRYFYPGCHQMEPYRSAHGADSLRLPETEALSRRVLSLPTGTAVDAEHVAGICSLIRLALDGGSKLSKRLDKK
jgi:dTDP-4-amino-4,6-dideoxygalactose transaminase